MWSFVETHSFPTVAGKSSETLRKFPQNLLTKKLGGITIFHAVVCWRRHGKAIASNLEIAISQSAQKVYGCSAVPLVWRKFLSLKIYVMQNSKSSRRCVLVDLFDQTVLTTSRPALLSILVNKFSIASKFALLTLSLLWNKWLLFLTVQGIFSANS